MSNSYSLYDPSLLTAADMESPAEEEIGDDLEAFLALLDEEEPPDTTSYLYQAAVEPFGGQPSPPAKPPTDDPLPDLPPDFGGKKPTLSDLLDRVAIANGYASVGAMTATEKNSFKRFLRDYELRAAGMFSLPLRDLSLDQIRQINALVGTEIADPAILPEDDPRYKRASDRAYALGVSESRYQSRREQAERLWQAHRLQIRAESEETYQRRRAERRAEAALKVGLEQPKPLAAPAASRRPAVPSWSTIAGLLSPDDLRALTSAWRGGSLGTTAISQPRLSRYMAYLPFASSPYGFVSVLRAAWAQSGGGTSRRTTPIPRGSAAAAGSTPRPVRFSRNAVAAAPQPTEQLSLMPPPAAGALTL